MYIKDFKAGTYRQQYQYKSYSPTKINHDWIWDDPVINVLLEKATKALGELNAYTFIVPDVELFIQMHIVKEVAAFKPITQRHAWNTYGECPWRA